MNPAVCNTIDVRSGTRAVIELNAAGTFEYFAIQPFFQLRDRSDVGDIPFGFSFLILEMPAGTEEVIGAEPVRVTRMRTTLFVSVLDVREQLRELADNEGSF